VKRLVDTAAGREVREASVPRLGPDTDPGGTEAPTATNGRRTRRAAAPAARTPSEPDVVDETPTGRVPRVV
jgi:hypothetical protein